MYLQIWRLKRTNTPSSVILEETRPGDLDNTVDNRGMRMAMGVDTELTEKQTGNYCSCGNHILKDPETSKRKIRFQNTVYA